MTIFTPEINEELANLVIEHSSVIRNASLTDRKSMEEKASDLKKIASKLNDKFKTKITSDQVKTRLITVMKKAQILLQQSQHGRTGDDAMMEMVIQILRGNQISNSDTRNSYKETPATNTDPGDENNLSSGHLENAQGTEEGTLAAGADSLVESNSSSSTVPENNIEDELYNLKIAVLAKEKVRKDRKRKEAQELHDMVAKLLSEISNSKERDVDETRIESPENLDEQDRVDEDPNKNPDSGADKSLNNDKEQ